MKRLIPVVIVFMVIGCMNTNVNGQNRKNNEQLYFMNKEVVKDKMTDQYLKSSKVLISICQETEFPFPYILWGSQENHYHLWYPIDELNEIDQINRAWDNFEGIIGKESFNALQACVESSIPRVMVAYLDLIYEPDEPRLQEEETNFCRMSQLYLKKGSRENMKALASKLIELAESKGVKSNFYFGEGRIGFESPVIFYWSFARDLQDYLLQEAEATELQGEELQKIKQEISQYVRRTETVDFHYIEGLSYTMF